MYLSDLYRQPIQIQTSVMFLTYRLTSRFEAEIRDDDENGPPAVVDIGGDLGNNTISIAYFSCWGWGLSPASRQNCTTLSNSTPRRVHLNTAGGPAGRGSFIPNLRVRSYHWESSPRNFNGGGTPSPGLPMSASTPTRWTCEDEGETDLPRTVLDVELWICWDCWEDTVSMEPVSDGALSDDPVSPILLESEGGGVSPLTSFYQGVVSSRSWCQRSSSGTVYQVKLDRVRSYSGIPWDLFYQIWRRDKSAGGVGREMADVQDKLSGARARPQRNSNVCGTTVVVSHRWWRPGWRPLREVSIKKTIPKLPWELKADFRLFLQAVKFH